METEPERERWIHKKFYAIDWTAFYTKSTWISRISTFTPKSAWTSIARENSPRNSASAGTNVPAAGPSCTWKTRCDDQVQEDTRKRFQDKRDSESLIGELADILDSLEHVKFPVSGKPEKEAEEEVEVDDKLAKIHDLDSKFVQFKESFFKMRRSRKGEFFLDSLKNIQQDSPIVRFYKTMNFREIVDRELGVCSREDKIKQVRRI